MVHPWKFKTERSLGATSTLLILFITDSEKTSLFPFEYIDPGSISLILDLVALLFDCLELIIPISSGSSWLT
jgi:hypothetical protein